VKKSGFTLEEHRDVGAQLELIRNELNTLGVKIFNAYPRSVGGDGLDGAVKQIDQMRSDLDEEVFKENPELSRAVLENIYYGNPSRIVNNDRSEST
jgi:hypothetical protein